MNLRISSLIALLISTALAVGQIDAVSDEELLDIGRKALKDHATAKGGESKKAAFRSALQGLSDAQKIRAVAYRVLASDDDPKHTMKSSNTMAVAYALGQDRELVEDWNELREMLRRERDPRQFFLLSGLVPWSDNNVLHDFVFEFTHMLFADGRVAKDEGEYTRAYAHDVSEYAYTAVIGNLRALGAEFEPPAKNLPHEEQAVILAKWLKENWSSCENIEIPRRLSGEEPRPEKAFVEKEKPSFVQIKKREQEKLQETNAENESRLPWIIAGVLLVGILALLLKAFKGKSTA